MAMVRSKKLTWRNKQKFFRDVKVGNIYTFDSWAFDRKNVSILAGKNGVKIEKDEQYRCAFRIIEIKELEQRTPALFDTKKLDI